MIEETAAPEDRTPRAGGRGPRIGPLQAALLAASPAFVVLVLTPATIYLGNQPYFDHRHVVVLHLALVHVLLVLCLYLAMRMAPHLRRPLAYSLGLLGAFLLGVSLLAPSPVEQLLEGGIRGLQVAPGWVFLDVALLAAIGVLSRYVPAQRLVDIGSVFCVLAALGVAAVVGLEGARADEQVSQWVRGARPGPEPIARSPSVYHLVFDGFDATEFERVLDALDIEPMLAGFVWHPGALSNYTSTRLSFPSFMTGRLFDASITDETGGRIGRSEGLVATLADEDYVVSQYNAYFVNNHVLTHERHSTATLEERLYGGLRHVTQLLDLSVMLVAPVALKTRTAVDGRGLVSHWLLRADRSIADWSRNPPLLSLLLLDQLIADEAARPASGQYVNAHFLLPHAPYVLTAGCEYQPDRPTTHASVAEQSACTVSKFTEFVAELRRLGRLRDSMVVIHSDHGTLQRERPLLLVKVPGRRDEPFEIDARVVQLADIVPSIHSALGLDLGGLDGLPLQAVASDQPREIQVWMADPSLR